VYTKSVSVDRLKRGFRVLGFGVSVKGVDLVEYQTRTLKRFAQCLAFDQSCLGCLKGGDGDFVTPQMDDFPTYLQRVDINCHGIFYSCNYLRFNFKEVGVFVVKNFSSYTGRRRCSDTFLHEILSILE
jgi:hypothetical protein